MTSTLADTTADLARIQFATTSIYHFFFVPLTLGLGPIVAVMQTMWHRTRDERWLRLTHFFGTLFLINFAIGVATGLGSYDVAILLSLMTIATLWPLEAFKEKVIKKQRTAKKDG